MKFYEIMNQYNVKLSYNWGNWKFRIVPIHKTDILGNIIMYNTLLGETPDKGCNQGTRTLMITEDN